MTIRTKVLSIVGISLITLCILMAGVSFVLVTGRFSRLESKEAARRVTNIENQIDFALSNLAATVVDWAPWDDTYQFIQDKNNSYIENNLADATIANLRLNFMLYFGENDDLVYSRFHELKQAPRAAFQDALLASLEKNGSLLNLPAEHGASSGLMLIMGKAFYVTAHAILTSQFKGPARGTLVMGRALDPSEVKRISGITQIEFDAIPVKPDPMDPDLAAAALELKTSGKIFTHTVSSDIIAGYALLPDLAGEPAIFIKVYLQREIFWYGFKAWRDFMLVMLAVVAGFWTLLMLLLDKTVLLRIRRVVQRINALAGEAASDDEITVEQNDEIGRLSQSINTLLACRQNAHRLQIENEKKYRAVVEDETTLICRINNEGVLTFVNGAFCRFFGNVCSDLEGNRITNIIPDFPMNMLNALRTETDGHGYRTIRQEIANAQNQICWLQWKIRLLRPESEDTMFQLAGHDITEQKAVEEKLKDNEQYLTNLLDSINFGVMVVDARERRVVDINAAGAKLLERKREEIIGRVCHKFICPNDRFNCPVLDLEHQIDSSERKLLRPDGTMLPILKSVETTERNGRTYLIESFADLSKLKQAQAALEKSEKRYRTFFEEDLTGDFIMTADGTLLECNRSFAKIFGFDSSEQIHSITVDQFYPSRKHRKMLLNRLRKEKRLENVELELIHRDGHTIYCIGNLIGHFDTTGELVEISGYFFDDTKRVILERDFRQAQKLEAIGTLAGGIAHDFNNILSGIMGYTELVLNSDNLSPDDATRLRNIIKAVHRARELIQQILTFSRQSEGETGPVKVMPIIKEVVKLMRASLPTTIEIRQPHQFPSTVAADPIQLHQVVMNLCTNAGYAMKKNGGCLSIAVDQVELAEDFTGRYPGMAPGTFSRISIEDTGGGILEEIKDRIFDPFFSTKDKSEGTGLGLSVVHGIVTRLKGAINVSTTPVGALFEVYLPCIEPQQEQSDVETVTMPRGSEHIVFIDDENFQVDIGTQMLEALGYQSTGFTDSELALRYITENIDDIDLVLTDMTMPKLTGLALSRKLLESFPQLPIIITTGFSEEITPEIASAMGIRGYIMKPIEVKKIAGKVRQILDEKNAGAGPNAVNS